MGFGDDMLRFNGLGERITVAMNNNTSADRRRTSRSYYEIVRWAAERGMTLTMHWGHDASVGSSARHLRAGEPRDADRAAALVDRASERRVGGDARRA